MSEETRDEVAAGIDELEAMVQTLEALADEPGLSEDEAFARRRNALTARHDLLVQRNLHIMGSTMAKTATNVQILAENTHKLVQSIDARLRRLEERMAE